MPNIIRNGEEARLIAKAILMATSVLEDNANATTSEHAYSAIMGEVNAMRKISAKVWDTPLLKISIPGKYNDGLPE